MKYLLQFFPISGAWTGDFEILMMYICVYGCIWGGPSWFKPPSSAQIRSNDKKPKNTYEHAQTQ